MPMHKAQFREHYYSTIAAFGFHVSVTHPPRVNCVSAIVKVLKKNSPTLHCLVSLIMLFSMEMTYLFKCLVFVPWINSRHISECRISFFFPNIWNLLSNWFPYNTQCSSQKVPSSIPIPHPPRPPTPHQPSVCSQFLTVSYALATFFFF